MPIVVGMSWSLFSAAADLVLGADCAGCGTPGVLLCRSCTALCTAEPHRVPAARGRGPIWAAGEYDGTLRRVETAYKERGRHRLAGLLGGRLATAVAALLVDVGHGAEITLVPMPSSARAVRARGLDTVHALAERCAERLCDVGVHARVLQGLHHARRVNDQAGLTEADRWTNLAGALAARPVIGPVVIVDDITTTGASLVEAERALGVADAFVLGSAVVAATPKRRLEAEWSRG